MVSDLTALENRLRVIEILLAGLLLQREIQPEVEKLEKLIGIRKGTLSDLFPQRKSKDRSSNRK
jgi:Trp operon repressor